MKFKPEVVWAVYHEHYGLLYTTIMNKEHTIKKLVDEIHRPWKELQAYGYSIERVKVTTIK